MDGRDFKKNRSDRYQWVLVEAPCSPEMLTEFSDAQSIGGKLNHYIYNEELYDLQERLKDAFWRIIDTQLTQRQREVLRLYADGYTQIEIAKKLKVNQSSITKSINGNCDYRNGKKIYGGAKKKLKRIASKDPEIQAILKRIAEIQDDGRY
ncbi:MAG TPA: LuxR C-terminal-related transcriptional regulator [Anaerovoracaceae bacterium]|nr:LuxR C-terminal-related transcriptional regulator [Anaerovoracaceae bacterium]